MAALSEPVDILLIASGSEEKFLAPVAEIFSCSFKALSDIDQILESQADPSLLVICEFTGNKEFSVDELMQISKQQFPEAFLILVIDKETTKEKADTYAKLGAQIVMLKSELSHAKIAYAINQILHATYVPLKTVDLVAENVLPFSVYHLMPKRKKFLKIINADSLLASERLTRLSANSEFYIHRSDTAVYKKYIETTSDKSAKGLAKRCRANFTALQTEFTNLVFELSDESSKASFGQGKELLARCTKLCDDLLTNLAEFPKAWEVINSSSVGEFGSLERAPAVAAYCGMFALYGDIEQISEVMLVSLIIDVAITNLSVQTAEKIRSETLLSDEEMKVFRSVPLKSLDMVLNRKVAIPEKLRSILLCVYERADGRGYPNRAEEHKLSFESQFIRFAKEFDARTLIKMGRARQPPIEILQSMMSDPELKGVFTKSFIDLVQNRLVPQFR